ncbi:hypothetical protein A2011_02490 [candidate division CPR3 bacterium GWE2_35_7]|nr:MAG: Thioredoxin reductase [candidate division CPR3 bacterium GW2011_GWE2_35_7]OGB79704.1 MAG: hypothetical protein A2011_02490 [candidate division CPR3 bacterium GWE2_35_7]
MENQKMVYDLLIIGAGPAGFTASIYASRYKVSNLVIGPELGGTIAKAHKVENYPGFLSIPGFELGQKMSEQVKNLGSEIKLETVAHINKNDLFELTTNNGNKYYSKMIIIASGTERRKLNILGEDKYLGRGISYCTNCDAPFFRNKKVAVVGGGDAAITGALHLNEIASEIYLIYRRKKEDLRAEPAWLESLAQSKVIGIYETNPIEVLGDETKVTGLMLDKPFKGQEVLGLDGVFVEIGAVPVSKIISPLGVVVDESGFIKVDASMQTNIEGIYAAGDITEQSKVLQQVITAEAQGAIAAASVFRKIKGKVDAPKQWG